MPVVLDVGAGRTFVIEDDAAPALGTLSHSREHTPVVPAMVHENFPTKINIRSDLVGATGFEPVAPRL